MRLRRILTNLIDNALKFGGAAEIVARRDADGALRLMVMDRGAGIPRNSSMRCSSRSIAWRPRGTAIPAVAGWGLAIAQQLAQALGGKLALRNREGGGLSAEVILP